MKKTLGIARKIASLLIVLSLFLVVTPNTQACEIKKEFISIEVRDKGLNADFYYNKYGKNQKAIVVFGGSEGGKSWSEDSCESYRMRLLNEGYAVLSLGYFAAEGLPAVLEGIPMEYFNTAIDWVLKQPGIDHKGVAVMGWSKGGEAALLLASINPKVKAVVGIVPAANVYQGISENIKSSWTYKGEDVPFAPFVNNEALFESLRKMNEEGVLEFVQVYNDAIADPEIDEMSAIKIENSKANILLLSGKNDTLWDSEGMSRKVIQRLDDKKYRRFYDHISYDTGHSVFEKEEEVWQDIMSFLKKQYKSKK